MSGGRVVAVEVDPYRPRPAASLTHYRPPGHPELVRAQQNLATLVIEQFVRKTLAGKPPLTDEQVRRIIALLAAR